LKVEIAVFARAPVAGHAKTRLIPRLGADGAAAFQHALIHQALRTALAANLGPVSLWCAPDCAHPAFNDCVERFRVALYPQQGADLGARMFDAFSQLCSRGGALVIGTDCPALSVGELRAAADALREDNEAVFVPAEDGGYVLVGLRQAVGSLFVDIPWGVDRVMDQTRNRLRSAGLRWRELAPSWDVDRPEDFDRLRASGLLTELGDAIG
jgi:rSAM/selenodomain-associated transferase 1